MSNYKSFLNQFKRKSPDSPSSSETDSPEPRKPVSKKLNLAETDMESVLAEISQRFDTLQKSLATKEDIDKMKTDFKTEMDKLTASFVKKIDSLEEKLLKVESERETLKNEVEAVKRTNSDLFEQINRQTKQLVSLQRTQNDLEQHGRKWNLRVFNIPEPTPGEPETAAACAKKCCEIFTSMVGVPVTEADVEIAHRIGNRSPRQTRSRPIIVRFHARQKRDEVLTKRRQLKGNQQKISVAEDLTSLNFKLLKDAQSHSATMQAWSSNGKIIAKLKNGKILKVEVYSDMDTIFRNAM